MDFMYRSLGAQREAELHRTAEKLRLAASAPRAKRRRTLGSLFARITQGFAWAGMARSSTGENTQLHPRRTVRTGG